MIKTILWDKSDLTGDSNLRDYKKFLLQQTRWHFHSPVVVRDPTKCCALQPRMEKKREIREDARANYQTNSSRPALERKCIAFPLLCSPSTPRHPTHSDIVAPIISTLTPSSCDLS